MQEGFTEKVCIEKDCGRQFVIEPGEKDWYERRGMTLPNRCKDCRARRKAAKEQSGQ
jgi:Probable zinc-ribbon domain